MTMLMRERDWIWKHFSGEQVPGTAGGVQIVAGRFASPLVPMVVWQLSKFSV